MSSSIDDGTTPHHSAHEPDPHAPEALGVAGASRPQSALAQPAVPSGAFGHGEAPHPHPPTGTSRLDRAKAEWLSNPGQEILAGLLVAFALIPEVIAFSIAAGVDPKVGLYASFTIPIVISVFGGRPALISAAAGSMALVMAPLVREHGVAYLFPLTVLTGILQFVLGALGVGRLMRFVPRTVMVGFVNALAILIFSAQMPHLVGQNWAVWALVGAGLLMIQYLPMVTTKIPAGLVAIAVLTAVVFAFHVDVPTVGDEGELPTSLPVFGAFTIPWTLETLRIIAPYAAALAMVGLLETLLTAQLVDDATDTTSDKDRESRGQGLANIVTGLFGGMAGCAMIGQTMINLKSGGRGRLSTLMSGVWLFVLVLLLTDVVRDIPMAALVAVMIVVSAITFDWSSIQPKRLRRAPRTETAVLVVTVAVVVATKNLAYGVIAGVLLSTLFFARRVAHLVTVTSTLDDVARERRYVLEGALFFASTNELMHVFDFTDPTPNVVLDLSNAHVWDSSAVATLDAVVDKFAARGVTARIEGLNRASADLFDRTTSRS